jgi:hypothetical protein
VLSLALERFSRYHRYRLALDWVVKRADGRIIEITDNTVNNILAGKSYSSLDEVVGFHIVDGSRR